jgi:hypothetical protein
MPLSPMSSSLWCFSFRDHNRRRAVMLPAFHPDQDAGPAGDDRGICPNWMIGTKSAPCGRGPRGGIVGDPMPGASPMPLALTDDEYNAVQAAAAPIHPRQRAAFLKALAGELEKHAIVGPGIVHRCARDLQKTFVVEAHSETSTASRNQSRRTTG